MSSPQHYIRPNTYVFLQLQSAQLRLVEIKPNTIIDIGKIGAFPANLLLGRPFYNAYELLDKREDEAYNRLRTVPAHELNAEVITKDESANESIQDGTPARADVVPEEFDLLDAEGRVIMKNNRLTIDDSSRQALSQQEIEELKQSHGGKEIIEKILANHSGLDEKTDYSRAKYTLRKTKKYLKRFTVFPVDVPRLTEFMLDKEAQRIMELRPETLGLLTAWSNAHCSVKATLRLNAEGKRVGGGRWIVVDDTSGLIVAALGEKLGILWRNSDDGEAVPGDTLTNGDSNRHSDEAFVGGQGVNGMPTNQDAEKDALHRDFPLPSATTSITTLHPAVQPNLSILKYFGYNTNNPDPMHPLHTHLKSISLLQLLHPDEDTLNQEPEIIGEEQLSSLKSAKRGTYHKKRRRWARIRSIIDETREGGFDGLVIATHLSYSSLLPHVIPLVRGGGTVAIYHPTIEPLKTLMDLYSKDRKLAYISELAKGANPDPDDFPVDPRLLLGPSLQTTRIRQWQVLPGRTHPLMSGRGGSEGYLFTARRVIPLEGGVEARGNFSMKKRKAADSLPPNQ